MVKISLSVVLICLLFTLTSASVIRSVDESLADRIAEELESQETDSDIAEVNLVHLEKMELDAQQLLNSILSLKESYANQLLENEGRFENKNVLTIDNNDISFRKRSAYRNFSKAAYSELLNKLAQHG